MNEMQQTTLSPADAAAHGVRKPPPDFDALYRESSDDLFAYLSFLVADRSLAEEITAQTFERAFRRRSAFDPLRGDLRGWLFRIARNAAIDELRKRKHTTSLELALENTGESFSEDAMDRVQVGAALKNLDPGQRELVALKFFAGLTNVEIARVVGQSESNVGTRLHRAIKQLREVLDV